MLTSVAEKKHWKNQRSPLLPCLCVPGRRLHRPVASHPSLETLSLFVWLVGFLGLAMLCQCLNLLKGSFQQVTCGGEAWLATD